MDQRQDRRARRKADAPATRQSSRRQRPGGKWIQPGGGNRCGRQQERPPNGKAGRLTENRPTDRKQTGRRRSGSDKKQGDAARRLHLPLLRDSGAVRTLDPQLRRLLLYPTELRNHRRAGPESPVCGCKGRKNFSFSSPFRRFMDENLPFFTELFCRAEFFVYICRLESPKRVSVLLTFLQNFIANGC